MPLDNELVQPALLGGALLWKFYTRTSLRGCTMDGARIPKAFVDWHN